MSRRKPREDPIDAIPLLDEQTTTRENLHIAYEEKDIELLFILVDQVANEDHPGWLMIEDSIRREIHRPGYTTDEEILEDIYWRLRSALTDREYGSALWIVYVGYKYGIYFVERYQRDWDLLLSTVPLGGKPTKRVKDVMSLLNAVFFANPESAGTHDYIHRLVKEQRWELLIRMFRLLYSGTYLRELVSDFGLSPSQIREILEYAEPGALERAIGYLRD